MTLNPASLIDHTLLRPDARLADIAQLCREAREHGFAAVCVNPFWLPTAVRELEGSGVKPCTVAGFPLGANTSSIKEAETAEALDDGAAEIDVVLNVGALLDEQFLVVETEISRIAVLCHQRNAILKVILETALLTDQAKREACKICMESGADFVKTSTGFASGGATVEDVRLMRSAVGEAMGVKASGGVRTLEAFEAMIAAGANRIGTSSGVKILEAARH